MTQNLLQEAERAGILDRACEILLDTMQEVTDQVSTGAAQIRAYRLWLDREKRHGVERRGRR